MVTLLVACGDDGFAVEPTHKDVSYTPTKGSQKLDIYLPAGEGPFPVVMNIHGGGGRGR